MTWTENYQSRIGTPEEAMSLIKSRDSVYLHAGAATPQLLVDAFSKRAMELEGVTISHILSLGDAKYVTPEMEGHVRLNSLFTGTNVRESVNAGRADWTPIFLSEIPGLFKNGHIPVDVAIIHVSPPDSHGFCSFGVSTDTTIAACKRAKIIVAMVNRQMPRVHGDNFIHASKLDFIVEANEPLFQTAKVELSEQHMLIGKYIASLIEDGSTLQMGIGAIPDATLFYLKEKRNLGIHTEMFSDGVVELVESGVINGEEKTLHTGKVVSSIVMGSQHVYDFINENPFMEFHPTDYVNDPYIIAQNNKMVAINSSIEIDLTGQVCSDSMGRTNFSGIGGQVDFMRGASRSNGGKPIIAMPSTAKQGTQSRIVLDLKPGAAVTTSRGDVHYIVTEYGIAHLHGKTLRDRAKALIAIAHPDFREELEKQSFESKLLH